jgi:hypothetical protein
VLCLTVFDRGIETASCDGMLTCYWFNYSWIINEFEKKPGTFCEKWNSRPSGGNRTGGVERCTGIAGPQVRFLPGGRSLHFSKLLLVRCNKMYKIVILQVNYAKRSSFHEFLTHLEFSSLALQIWKTLCKSLEGICNIPIGCCNIPMQKNFILNFPNFLF